MDIPLRSFRDFTHPDFVYMESPPMSELQEFRYIIEFQKEQIQELQAEVEHLRKYVAHYEIRPYKSPRRRSNPTHPSQSSNESR